MGDLCSLASQSAHATCSTVRFESHTTAPSARNARNSLCVVCHFTGLMMVDGSRNDGLHAIVTQCAADSACFLAFEEHEES